MATTYADETVSAEADVIARKLDDGYLRFYTGPRPATADTPITDQVMLAELRFGDPSAAGAIAGVISFDTFTADEDAEATGTAAWFRALKSDGVSPVMDGSIGTSASADLVLNSTSIQIHAHVSLDAFTHSVAKS